MQRDNIQLYKLLNWPLFVQLQACTPALVHLAPVLHLVSLLLFGLVWLKNVDRAKVPWTHGEVFAIKFELLPHVDELVEVRVVKQQVNRHVPLPAGHQDVTQQLHIAEAFHHYGQGLHRQVNDPFIPPPYLTRTEIWQITTTPYECICWRINKKKNKAKQRETAHHFGFSDEASDYVFNASSPYVWREVNLDSRLIVDMIGACYTCLGEEMFRFAEWCKHKQTQQLKQQRKSTLVWMTLPFCPLGVSVRSLSADVIL